MTLPETTANPSKRPRRLRYTLRSLLVAVTVVCLALGYQVNRGRRQIRAVQAIEATGGSVWYNDEYGAAVSSIKDFRLPLAWLPRELGEGLFWKVTAASVGRLATDADLEAVTDLPHVERLWLDDSAITDRGLVHLRGLHRLKELGLEGTRVEGPGLAHVAGLTNLEELSLFRTPLANEGLPHVAAMAALRRLDLGYSLVTDDGLPSLCSLSRLSELNLYKTAVTDHGLGYLQSLPSLKSLSLGGTMITDDGLGHLNSRKLKWLHLGHTVITDRGVERLSHFARLERLTLDGTDLTDACVPSLLALMPQAELIQLHGIDVSVAGLAALKSALPRCAVLPRPNEMTPTSVWPAEYEPSRPEVVSKLNVPLGRIVFSGDHVTNLCVDRPVIEPDLTKILCCLPETRSLSIYNHQPLGAMSFTLLANMASLRCLGLVGCSISDADLADVKTLSGVVQLSLAGNRITDAGIVHLREMKQLEILDLDETRVTRPGIEELRRALPQCEISY